MKQRAAILLAGVLLFPACDPEVDRPDGGLDNFLDGKGSRPPPGTPALDLLAARTPYTVATLRGTTSGGARRIIVEGGRNPIATTVLPGGDFCVDVPTPDPGAYEFHVYAQGEDGQLSDGFATASTQFDPSAPAVPGAQTCSGSDPAGCPSSVEICGNGRDDNCNNLIDQADPQCGLCPDDSFEPNDDIGAPRVDPGRYDELKICPGSPDFYGIFVRARERLTARTFFSHAEGNIDLELLGFDRSTVLARSVSLDDDELLTVTATASGEYKLVVFSESGTSVTYDLDIRVETGM